MKLATSKPVLALLSALLVFSTLTGCGAGAGASSSPAQGASSSAAAPESALASEPVTLSILVTNTADLSGMEAVFAQMEKDIGIKMEIEKRPAGAEGENIVRARLASGDSTDIYMFNAGSLLSTVNPAQNFVNITNEPFAARMLDSYKQTVTVDDALYGIPVTSTRSAAWLYNKKAYADLGLEVPKTWDELMANCEAVKAAGKTAVIGSFATDWTAQFILLADFYNVQAKDPAFAANFNANKDKFATNQYAFKAFEHMAEVYERGFMNVDYNATTYDVALKMLADGDGVHYPMLTSAIGVIDTNFGREAADGIGAFAQPGDDPNNTGVTVWMPDTFYFSKESPKQEAMMRFAEYYLSKESVALYAQNQQAVGAYAVQDAALPDDAYTAVKDLVPYFEAGKIAPALEFITNVKGPNSSQICIQGVGGMKPALECAEEYDKDVEKQAKQLGIAGW